MSTVGHSARPLWRSSAQWLWRTRSVLLGYHGVAHSPVLADLSLLQLEESRFRTQIELLLEAGFEFSTLADYVSCYARDPTATGRAVITFDDGLRNNYTTALPILQEYGIPATVYVTVGLIGKTSPWIHPQGDNSMLDEADVRALSDAGWEIGAHTMTHPDLATLDYAACRQEIESSRLELQRITGTPVCTFAYPFGRYGPQAVQAVRDAGFTGAVGTGEAGPGVFELSRAMIGGRDPMPIIMLKMAGRYEPLLQTAPGRIARRTVKQVRERVQERQREKHRG